MNITMEGDAAQLQHVQTIINLAGNMLTATLTSLNGSNVNVSLPTVYINQNTPGIDAERGITVKFYQQESRARELQKIPIKKTPGLKSHSKERVQKSTQNASTPTKAAKIGLVTATIAGQTPTNIPQPQETAKTPTGPMSEMNLQVHAQQNPQNQHPAIANQVIEPPSYDTAIIQSQLLPQGTQYHYQQHTLHPPVLSIPENTATYVQHPQYIVHKYDNISPAPPKGHYDPQNQMASTYNPQPIPNHNIHMRPTAENQYMGHPQPTAIQLDPRRQPATNSHTPTPVTNMVFQDFEQAMGHF